MRFVALLTSALLVASSLRAECVGQNLITALPQDQRASLSLATDAVPFPRGNFWRAQKDGRQITLVGTFHLDDPRHDATMVWLAPQVLASRTLLVEAGPAEVAQLNALISAEPQRLINTQGPTLPEALPEADWLRLSDALRNRGIAPFMAAKMQPWYVSTLLAIPACQFALAAAMNGLDQRLIATAETGGVAIAALEPFDTIFTIFDSFASQDQLAMLIQTLDATAGNDDMAVTLADAYFSGDSRLYWEFTKLQLQTRSGMTPAAAEREFALADTAMLTRRNQDWIAPIEAAAVNGPVTVAFGALHLSGEKGVLNLLAKAGWTVAPVVP